MHEKRQAPGYFQKWCKTFRESCVYSAVEVCGGANIHLQSCSYKFTGDPCAVFTASCECSTSAGTVKNATAVALQKTNTAMNITCGDPSTTVATPAQTSVQSSPSPTSNTENTGSSNTKAVLSSVLLVMTASLSGIYM
ncbi:hypothetical protein BGZ76_003119 [Entomortierella beljakovae]|nr:hypothetical protein BGZ76_003119 [Entomortierella beljakovae]